MSQFLTLGHAVDELIGDSRVRPHTLTPFAQVEGERITYPPLSEEAPASTPL